MLGLTDFLAVINDSDLMQSLLNNTDFVFTLFAPTNAAFQAMLEPAEEINQDLLVGHHLVEGIVKVSDLVFDQRFMSFFNTTLHSTTVVYGDKTLYQYNYQHAKDHSNSMITYTNVSYLSLTPSADVVCTCSLLCETKIMCALIIPPLITPSPPLC